MGGCGRRGWRWALLLGVGIIMGGFRWCDDEAAVRGGGDDGRLLAIVVGVGDYGL